MALNVVVCTMMKDLHNCLKNKLKDKIILKSFGTNDEIPLADLQNADILLAEPRSMLKKDLIRKCPNLKWFHSPWAGIEIILKYDWPSNRPLITRTVGHYPEQMAEWAIGSMIAMNRQFFGMRNSQLDHKWGKPEFCNFFNLNGSSIGILGCGSIGKELAKRAKSFNMTVWALTRTSNKKGEYIDHIRNINDLDEILSNCDYICNILPHTMETINLLSNKRLNVCRDKQPLFLNMGRGSVISDESLFEALDQKWIRGAVLDVFNTEPLPADNELYNYPNVFVTHHTAGVAVGPDIAEDFGRKFEKFILNEELPDTVTIERPY